MLDNRHIHARQFKSIWPYINVFFITTDNLTIIQPLGPVRLAGVLPSFLPSSALQDGRRGGFVLNYRNCSMASTAAFSRLSVMVS